MTYIGVTIGQYGNRFMCSNNTIFTSATVQFDENSFPRSVAQNKMHRNPNPLPTQGGDDDRDIPDLTPSSSNKWQEPRQQTVERSPSPPIAQQEEPQPFVPRRSTRQRKVPTREGNVYGESRHPAQQFRDIESQRTWRRLVGEAPDSSSVPQTRQDEQIPVPSSPTPGPSEDVDDPEPQVDVAKLCQEGGVALINYLLLKAIPPIEPPSQSNIREWTYHDIARLPKAEQTEWQKACEEELEALHRRKVFEIVDRP